MNKVFIVEGIWRGLFIAIGLFSSFAILFTTSDYNMDRKILLLVMLCLLYIGIFFNLTIKNIFISIIVFSSILLIYLYFFANTTELVKHYEIIFPVILIGLINLGYLKLLSSTPNTKN